jgi:hypothetical protein
LKFRSSTDPKVAAFHAALYPLQWVRCDFSLLLLLGFRVGSRANLYVFVNRNFRKRFLVQILVNGTGISEMFSFIVLVDSGVFLTDKSEEYSGKSFATPRKKRL